MFDWSTIDSVQLEITNNCNAACPQCPRNFFGGRTIPHLPRVTWTWKEFKKVVNQLPLKTLRQIYFCGTYGDPLMHRLIADMTEWLRDINPNLNIGLHTNGGAGSVSTWTRLAKTLDFAAFGIDGLADTNHIYRRFVKWSKLMQNVRAYIDAGGIAHWDFIPFLHNQHQVESAWQLSQQLGFKEFSIKRTSRFVNRIHQYSPDLTVYDRDGNVDYMLHLPTIKQLTNPEYSKIHWLTNRDNMVKTEIKCNALKISEIYIGADGFVFPCGWLHDRMYGPEIDNHRDHFKLLELINQAGGLQNINTFHTSLQSILANWFPVIQKSWSDGNRLDRCAVMCGSEINLIGSQNQEITYKT